MVFVNCPERGLVWVSAADCVWNSSQLSKNKHALSEIYSDCQNLFSKVLDIRDMTVDAVLRELDFILESPFSEDTIEDVRSALLDLSAFEMDDLEGVCGEHGLLDPSHQPFLPVIQPDTGEAILEAREGDFYIADDPLMLELFKDRVPLLDFTIDEHPRLCAFYETLRLEHRYLTCAVQRECYEKSDCLEDSNLTQDFRRKAVDIYRYVDLWSFRVIRADLRLIFLFSCFLHFRPEKSTLEARHMHGETRKLLSKLANFIVYRADWIGVLYKLETLDLHQHPRSETKMSLEENDDAIVLYLSGDQESLELATSCTLPNELALMMKLSGQNAEHALCNIFTSSGKTMSKMLDTLGVRELPLGVWDIFQSKFPHLLQQASQVAFKAQVSTPKESIEDGMTSIAGRTNAVQALPHKNSEEDNTITPIHASRNADLPSGNTRSTKRRRVDTGDSNTLESTVIGLKPPISPTSSLPNSTTIKVEQASVVHPISAIRGWKSHDFQEKECAEVLANLYVSQQITEPFSRTNEESIGRSTAKLDHTGL